MNAHVSPARDPELIVALVGALGADLERVSEELVRSLADVGYSATPVRVSALLHDLERWAGLPTNGPEDIRIEAHMDAGDDFRRILGRGDALAALAIGQIRKLYRHQETGSPEKPRARHAYVLRSLKNPQEVALLREVYGDRFLLVAAYSPRDQRVARLAGKIAQSRHSVRASDYLETAHRLLKRDEEDVRSQFGQDVRNVFALADMFVNSSDAASLAGSVGRFVASLFGYPYHTPTREEQAIYHARSAALRSASLARQVGAVVVDSDGEVISAGCNDVPKAGGGLYWEGDPGDKRDFVLGYETNDRIKRTNLAEALGVLEKAGWLSQVALAHTMGAREKEAARLLKKTQLMGAIEYNRPVHAEMAAIVGAARRGSSVFGATLFSTTFPCHDCAKHIVAAGIKRVVYIEPYPKSLAVELHNDAIVVDDPRCAAGRVSFEPFVGVAPRLYERLFAMEARKDDDGNVIDWTRKKATAHPRGVDSDDMFYLLREAFKLTALDAALAAHERELSLTK